MDTIPADILSMVQNHLFKLIIENKSETVISRHILRNPTYVDKSLIPQRLFLLFSSDNGTQFKYECKDPHKWILMCEFLTHILSDSPEEEITMEINMNTSLEEITTLAKYIDSLKDIPIIPHKCPYEPVNLFSTKIRKYIRDEDYEWFLFSLHEKLSSDTDDNPQLVSPRNAPIDGINWKRVIQICDAVGIANFLGCESFAIYTFLFLYVISVSLSCNERESIFGHRFFMLPIEGWDHPLKQIYTIPFLPEETVISFTDTKYLDVAKECEI